MLVECDGVHWPAGTQSCETCLYWTSSGGGLGLCRRRAPSVALRTEDAPDIQAKWPLTGLGDWCGEWRRSSAR